LARLTFPDERTVYNSTTSDFRKVVAGTVVSVFTDAAGTSPTTDLQTTGGQALTSLTIDPYSRIPLFQGPDGVDTLYVVIQGGPVSPIYARVDDRLDAHTTAISAETSRATAAEASVQSYAVQRSHHTGTQLAATISDFGTAAIAAGSGSYLPFTGGTLTGSLLSKGPLPFISTSALGCTGVSDDTSKIQTALDAVSTSVPVTLLVDCPVLLDGTNSQNGVSWAVGITRSNVTIKCLPGGKILRTQSSGCPFFVSGAGKPAGLSSWNSYRNTDATVYAIGAVTKGAVSVTTTTASDAGNFAAGDYVYLRTGNLTNNAENWTEPDAETFKVVSADAGTGIVTLSRPTGKAYAQEYFGSVTVTNKALTSNVATLTLSTQPYIVGDTITVSAVDSTFNGTYTVTATSTTTVSYALVAGNVVSASSSGSVVGTRGTSSTTSTAYAASFGIAKVTDRIISNITFEDVEFDCASTDRNVISAWQVEDLRIIRPKGRSASGLQTGRDLTGVWIESARFHQYSNAAGRTT
jgi:hypothetical protein